MKDCDVCVIGSGAGAAPIAHEAALRGRSVIVLEKGPWFREQDFFKDELACCERRVYASRNDTEPHVIESRTDDGSSWQAESSADPRSRRNWWNGNCVGGSSNFMSGYFYRMKPDDFRLLSAYGPIDGANLVDWPIDYDTLEPYYEKVERLVGVSGRVRAHAHGEPRSTADFPFPPTAEHIVAGWIDDACRRLGLTPLIVPRAILPQPALGRRGCEYSGYCGNYGCASGAKGSARAALLDPALATGRLDVRAHARVVRIDTDACGRATHAVWLDRDGAEQRTSARVFVVACQAVESARLLLLSTGPAHPHGLGNRHGQVGRNLVFSGGATGGGVLPFDSVPAADRAAFSAVGPFVNRGLQDWYVLDAPELGGRIKGGTVDFLMQHPNILGPALAARYDGSRPIWGLPLKRRLEAMFRAGRMLRFEAFCDWLPNDDCHVTLDATVRDHRGIPAARVRIGQHPHTVAVARRLLELALPVIGAAGFRAATGEVNLAPPPNLQAGGCRFGRDPRGAVLDPDCRVHGAENVYVTDGSFMPTGGAAPFTWTLYANAFRVADRLLASL